MATNVLNGTDMCLFIGTECIALAKSCKIGVSMATRDIGSKDSGKWSEFASGRLSWTCDSDNLFTNETDMTSYTYDDLYDMMIARSGITISVGEVTTPGVGYPQTQSTADASLTGLAYITKLDLNAASEDNTTFTISMQGTGALTHTAAI